MEGETYYESSPSNNNRKRSHDQFSADSSRFQPQWVSTLTNTLPADASSSSVYNSNTRPPRVPFPHDGLDFRTPIMSQPAPVSVIDLTDEPDSPPQPQTRLSNGTTGTTSTRASRLPRFSRDVIDLEDDTESYDADEDTQRAFEEALGDLDTPTDENGSSESPDVEILWSRPSETAQQPAQRPSGVGWHASLPRPGPSQRPLTSDWRRLTQDEPSTRMLSSIRNFFRLNDDETRVIAPLHRLGADIPDPLRESLPPIRYSHTAHSHQYNIDNGRFEFSASFQVPGNLQYDAPAFVVARDIPTHSALPLYDAPAPPRPGYTRSAAEDDVMVCPNCDGELGIGDTEVQRQVWIVKKCGHVFCGYCTINRFKGRPRQPRLARTKPFAHCVVEGCSKTAVSSQKAMFQLFV